jgi:methylthiol:coenzyme M methyltransferase
LDNKERFLNALRRQPVDRVPVAAVATGITVQMMEKCGIFWPEAHTRIDQLAGLAESIHLYTDVECIKLPFDMVVEVEAFGAPLDYRTIDTVPTEKKHISDCPADFVVPADFFDLGRVPTVLKAISLLRKRYDTETSIVASIVGPFSLAEKVFGFDNFLAWTITNPEWVHQAMEKLTPLAIQYAHAQVEAGADAIIVGEAGCSGDLISANTYRDFIAPYHRQLCPAIPAPTIMHICGKSTRHTPFIAETGATAYNFDEGVDIRIARQHMDGIMAVTGQVPTVTVLLNGTPDDVYRSSIESLDNGVQMLTPGCAMAPHTPLENVAAMTKAAADWNRSKTAVHL